jgi:DNA-binding transcriptional LysR family regulator
MVNALNAISSRLRMRHLRLLTILGDCGSLRKAAEIMSQTQPALTKSLHEIEELIGESLFSRTPKGIYPNTLGETLIRYARLVYADLGGAHRELTALKAGSIGDVQIGAISALTAGLVPQTVSLLKAMHPLLNITVVIETSDVLLRALEQDQLDLVIARIPEDYAAENLNFSALGEEIVVPVARCDHPEMNNRDLTLATLSNYSWVIQPQPAPLRRIFHEIFREARLRPPASSVETSSTFLALSLLKESDMISLQSMSLIDAYEKMNIIARLPIAMSINMDAYGLIRRRNRIPTAAMQVAADAFLRQAGLLAVAQEERAAP